jgi:hypothetical protein
LAFQGTDGNAYPDLSGSLGNRHEHDVHDADAADDQADAGDCAEEARQNGRGAGANWLRDVDELNRIADSAIALVRASTSTLSRIAARGSPAP